jgi:hypothetical protein
MSMFFHSPSLRLQFALDLHHSQSVAPNVTHLNEVVLGAGRSLLRCVMRAFGFPLCFLRRLSSS